MFNTDEILNSVPFLHISIAFVVFNYFFGTYLDWRQYKLYKNQKRPTAFATVISEEDFQLEQEHCLAKKQFGFFSGAFDFLETFLILAFNGISFLWGLAGNLTAYFGYDSSYEVLQSLVFITLYVVYAAIIHTPNALYTNICIEEKYNPSYTFSYLSYAISMTKKSLIGAVIGLPLLAAMIIVVQWGGEDFWFYVWILLTSSSVFMQTVYPSLLLPIFHKYGPLEDKELRADIETLAERINFPLTEVYIVNGSDLSEHSNAYYFGWGSSKRIVLYDSLLENLTHEEILAVLAHELGHWKSNHQLKHFVLSMINQLLLLYLFGYFVNNDKLYADFGFESRPTIIGFACFMFFISPVQHIYSFLLNCLSRMNEFQADKFSAEMGFDPRSALIQLHLEDQSHWISDPLYAAYHHSHPALLERLTELEKHIKKED